MLNAIKKYGDSLNTQDILKFAAIVLMVIDHLGHFYYPDLLWFRVLGRMCVPIWFFFIGYSTSQTIDKSLVGGALLLILLDILYFSPIFSINILGTIILCRLVHRFFLNDYLEKADFNLYDVMMLLFLVLIFYLPTMILVEYGSLALVFTSLGRLIQRGKRTLDIKIFAAFAILIFTALQTQLFHFAANETMVLGMGITLMVVLLYNYRLEHYPFTYSNPAILCVMFLARNSLYFYVIHWMILLTIDRYLNAYWYESLEWLE